MDRALETDPGVAGEERVERIWLKNFPPGVPAEIDMSPGDTLVTMLDDAFSAYPDRPAFACMGKQVSYRELEQQSADFGA